MERFALLIEELSEAMGQPLTADPSLRCRIIIDEKFPLHIEAGERQEQVLIVAFLADVPPGKFREVLFSDCLKHNALPFPRYGTLGYLEQTGQLTMHEFLTMAELNGEKLLDFLNVFIDKALQWKAALDAGSPVPTGVEPLQKGPSPMENL